MAQPGAALDKLMPLPLTGYWLIEHREKLPGRLHCGEVSAYFPLGAGSGSVVTASKSRHDPRILRLAMLTGMRHGIHKLILGGDIIATDQEALNTWLTTWAEDGEKTYAACLKELKQLIRACAEWFHEGIYAITGNHDERLAKKTGGQVTIQDMLEEEPINFSMYSYMYIHSPIKNEYTYLCHQYNYSKTPVKLAQNIWEVETAPDGSRSKCHVIVTHTHIEQTGWSPDGEWRCISLGCARDPKRTKYARLRATKFPNL